MMTGGGPASSTSEERYNYESSTFETSHAYQTANGQLASTTGNVYGIYDMSGGAWERVAGYLDNGNGSLTTYGKSTTYGNVKYFENGAIVNSYEKYWDRYEVGEEEKSNSIKIEESETLTQGQLWDANKNAEKYNAARMRITQETYEKMKNHKGEGMYETSSSFGFYGIGTDGNGNKSWNWFTTLADATANRVTYGRTWNGDLNLIRSCVYTVCGAWGILWRWQLCWCALFEYHEWRSEQHSRVPPGGRALVLRACQVNCVNHRTFLISD